MSVLVYIESKNSKPKKNSAEVISYGRALADMLSSELIILSFNIENTNVLSNYGPDKILNIKNDDLIKFNVQNSCKLSNVGQSWSLKIIGLKVKLSIISYILIDHSHTSQT